MDHHQDLGRPPVLGILGGIGSGKSAVAEVLESLGAVVIDADRIAKEIMQHDEVRDAIEERIGPLSRRPDGSLDREWIAQKVFSDEESRQLLNAIVHPRVRARIESDLLELGIPDPRRRSCSSPIDEISPRIGPTLVVLDIPLLLESDLNRYVDLYLYVDTEVAAREERVRETRGWDAEELRAREATQTSLAIKQERAQFVVSNHGAPRELERSVRELWPSIVAKASASVGTTGRPGVADRASSAPPTQPNSSRSDQDDIDES